MKNLVGLCLTLALSNFAYGFDVLKSIETASQNCKWNDLESDIKTGAISDEISGGYETYGCDKGKFINTDSGNIYRFDICGEYYPPVADSVWLMVITPSKDSTKSTETFFQYMIARDGTVTCSPPKN